MVSDNKSEISEFEILINLLESSYKLTKEILQGNQAASNAAKNELSLKLKKSLPIFNIIKENKELYLIYKKFSKLWKNLEFNLFVKNKPYRARVMSSFKDDPFSRAMTGIVIPNRGFQHRLIEEKLEGLQTEINVENQKDFALNDGVYLIRTYNAFVEQINQHHSLSLSVKVKCLFII